MTTAASSGKASTAAQRAAAAAENANQRFGFTDEKRILAAMAEVALEEMGRNAGFALQVRSRYDELAPQAKPKTPKAPKTEKPKLVPIKELPGYQLDVTRRLDPWFILEYYGSGQMETALRLQTIGNLREAVSVVEEHYPGTAPKGKVTKETAISYILDYALR